MSSEATCSCGVPTTFCGVNRRLRSGLCFSVQAGRISRARRARRELRRAATHHGAGSRSEAVAPARVPEANFARAPARRATCCPVVRALHPRKVGAPWPLRAAGCSGRAVECCPLAAGAHSAHAVAAARSARARAPPTRGQAMGSNRCGVLSGPYSSNVCVAGFVPRIFDSLGGVALGSHNYP